MIEQNPVKMIMGGCGRLDILIQTKMDEPKWFLSQESLVPQFEDLLQEGLLPHPGNDTFR